jgi:hypothetical protein
MGGDLHMSIIFSTELNKAFVARSETLIAKKSDSKWQWIEGVLSFN